jgi:exopolysaccharide production protein ExoQ
MSPRLVLAGAFLFIAWLFVGDKKRDHPFSRAMWIPLAWLLILSSRSVSMWFPNAELTGNAMDGSPLDRNIFLGLIIAAVLVLMRRGFSFGAFLRGNKVVMAYFAYLGVSVLWSDFTFIAFKRWVKDLGNVLIVLVVLTESDPVASLRCLLARCSYVLVPLSFVFIRYFPDIGRYFNRFVWSYSYGGVTLDKNFLGATALLCSLGIFLSFQECRRRGLRTTHLMILGGLNFFVYYIADCSTALVTTLLGLTILLLLQLPAAQARAERAILYSFGSIIVFLLLDSLFGISEFLVGLVGRDLTFTGRTDIWKIVLSVHVNPLIGVGYWSFWMGDRIDWKALGYMGDLLEAHNGYIETYVNSGLVGIGLLVAGIVHGLRRASSLISFGDPAGALKLTIIVLVLMYNFTESIFNRFGPVWFLALVALLEYKNPVVDVADSTFKRGLNGAQSGADVKSILSGLAV